MYSSIKHIVCTCRAGCDRSLFLVDKIFVKRHGDIKMSYLMISTSLLKKNIILSKYDFVAKYTVKDT